MKRFSAVYVAAVALPITLFLAVLTLAPRLFEDGQNFIFDLYQRIEPRSWSPDAPVRIIDIDDESLRRIGQWPWPRTRLADIVDKLAGHGAAAVGFDIVFAEPDRLSPDVFAQGIQDEALRGKLMDAMAGAETNDAHFAAAMSRLPTVLGVILSRSGEVAGLPQPFGLAAAGDDPKPFLPRFAGIQRPLPILEAAAAGFGALNWLPQRDLIVRRVPALLMAGDSVVPSLAAEMLRVGQGASTYVVRSSNASGQSALGASTGVNGVQVGAVSFQTGPLGDLRVRFSHTRPERFIPAWRLLTGEVPSSELDGRLVLVGASAAGLVDTRATPVDPAVPGVEVHAQIIESFLANNGLVRPDWAGGAEITLALVLAFAMASALRRVQPTFAATIALGWVFAMFALSWFAFSQHGVLLDPLPPVSLLGAVTLLGTFVLFRQAQQQRQQVREAFSRFVAPAVVERLAESPENLVLGGETRQLTLMFCDLRDFTAMSEGLDAQGITRFMNDYLTVVTDEILACGGTVDKYMGDAVMAFWNAPLDDPNHAGNATRAALAMVEALDRFNVARERALPPERFRRAQFGIGLSTGDCSVGNLGSVRRFDYSAIGDPVNLASRLESLTKMYGVQVLAPQETRDLAPKLAWLDLDVVRVKGRQAAGAIHALIGGEGVVGTAACRALVQAHESFRQAYRAGDLAQAEAAAASWTEAAGPFIEKPQIYVDVMMARLRTWSAQPERGAWDPVRTMTDK